MVGTSGSDVGIVNNIIRAIEFFSPVSSLDVGGVSDADGIKDNLLNRFKNCSILW